VDASGERLHGQQVLREFDYLPGLGVVGRQQRGRRFAFVETTAGRREGRSNILRDVGGSSRMFLGERDDHQVRGERNVEVVAEVREGEEEEEVVERECCCCRADVPMGTCVSAATRQEGPNARAAIRIHC
jgi:hypothetical protein